MKKIPTLLLVFGLTGVIVVWQITQQSPPDHSVAAVPADSSAVAREVGAEQSASIPLQRPAEPVSTPTPTEQVPEITAIWAPADDPDCIPETVWIPDQETGEVREVTWCPSNDEPHPYHRLSNEVLLSMSHGDAEAAEILGDRYVLSEDPQVEAQGISLMLHAAALTGSADPLFRPISARYYPIAENGEVQFHNLRQQLLLNLVAEAMGDERAYPDEVINGMLSLGVAQSEISELEEHARDILNQMAVIQTEMTGETSIREALEDV